MMLMFVLILVSYGKYICFVCQLDDDIKLNATRGDIYCMQGKMHVGNFLVFQLLVD